jgi:hypothetical protein
LNSKEDLKRAAPVLGDQSSKNIHILTFKMLSYLPNITLYLEEAGKERLITSMLVSLTSHNTPTPTINVGSA